MYRRNRGLRLTREGNTTRVSLGSTPAPPSLPPPPSGVSASDSRIQDLANAFTQAIAGNNSESPSPGTGIYYIESWINDQPPHPTYSNTYAQTLLSTLQQWAASAEAESPTSSTSVAATTNPATGQTTLISVTGTTGGTATLLGVPWYYWVGGVAAIGLVAAVA